MILPLEPQLAEAKAGFDLVLAAKGKAKEDAVRALAQNETALAALKLLLDPMTVFHLRRRSLEKPYDLAPQPLWNDLFSLCAALCTKRALNAQDVARIQQTLRALADPELRRFAEAFLCKEISLGVSAKTVNKALGRNEIPVFECMLAEKYFEHPDAVAGESFALTEKLDGCRCLLVAEAGKPPRFFTRQGQPIEGLVEIEADVETLTDSRTVDFVLDGELLVTDREHIPSKEQYKQTMQIVRRDGEKHGVTFNAFDILDVSVFRNHDCTTPYYLRRQKLEALVQGVAHVKVVPVLYVGSEPEEILRHLEAQRGLSHEGVMVNLLRAPYEFRRTRSLLKVKAMQDCDLRIIGVEEGAGKFAGTLGALVVDYKGSPVRVGSGMTDAFRAAVWAQPDKYVGSVVTVQYFEETASASGVKSIRFPVFKDLREPSKEVSYC